MKLKITQELILRCVNYGLAVVTMTMGCAARFDDANNQQLHDLDDTFTNSEQAQQNKDACEHKAKGLRLDPSACPLPPYDSISIENAFVAFAGMPLVFLLVDYTINAIKRYKKLDMGVHIGSSLSLLIAALLIFISAMKLDAISNPEYLKILRAPSLNGSVNAPAPSNGNATLQELQEAGRKRQRHSLKLLAAVLGVVSCVVCGYLAFVIWRRKEEVIVERVIKKTRAELEREEEAKKEGRGAADTLPLFFKLMNLAILSLTTFLAFCIRFDVNNVELLSQYNSTDGSLYFHGMHCIRVSKALGRNPNSECATPPFLANALESLFVSIVLICAVVLISHHTFTICKLQTPKHKKYGVWIFGVGSGLLFVSGILIMSSAVWVDQFLCPDVFLDEAKSLPEIHRRQFVNLARQNRYQARDAARLKWKLAVGVLCWICSILTGAVTYLLHKNSKHADVLEVPRVSGEWWTPGQKGKTAPPSAVPSSSGTKLPEIVVSEDAPTASTTSTSNVTATTATASTASTLKT